jgi:hypothetical protein
MDMVASAIAVDGKILDKMRAHYRDALGFEEQFYTLREDGTGLGLFSYGPSFFYIGTPGFLDLMPRETSHGCMSMIRVPHAAALRDVLAARCEDAVGPLVYSDLFGLDKASLEEKLTSADTALTSEADNSAHFFDVADPSGQTTRFMTLPNFNDSDQGDGEG